MTKFFSITLLTLSLFIGVNNISINQSEARDYWFYTEGNKEYYIDNEQSDFRPGLGDKHLLVKIIINNKLVNQRQWNFGFDEGVWFFGLRDENNSGMSTRDVPWAQAAVDFAIKHWTRNGFRE